MDCNQIDNEEYGIFENNGQRIFRPLDPTFLTSPFYEDVRNHEVFIDGLPNDLLEDELLPFLCRTGRVYQIRFIMSFSGKTKGKAFVIFEEVDHAFRAVEELDGQLIRPKSGPVTVRFSVNNRRLHVTNLPSHLATDEIQDHLDLIGLINIKVFPSSKKNPFINEAIITFENHQLASNARRLFEAGYLTIEGLTLSAHWAKPKDFQTLFVSFDKVVEDNTIRSFFEGENVAIQKITRHINKKHGGLNVFIKYKTFYMANSVRKFYSIYNFPIQIQDGIRIKKVAWPERKSI